jgi:hypothetical protein
MIYIILISFAAGVIAGIVLLEYLARRFKPPKPDETYNTLVIGEENIKDEKEIAELAQGLLHRIKNFKNN